MDSLEALLDAENIQPDDSLIGWARSFADSVLADSEIPPELLELIAKTHVPAEAGTQPSSNTQPGIPHPAVAAGLTGIPRDEGSGLRVIRSENIATKIQAPPNEGSGLRVLPSPGTNGEGSGLRALPPIPTREGSGLRPLPTGGSGLHALPNPPADDEDDDGEELEMLDDDELEMLDDDGESDDESDTAASASMSDDREAEPEWRRALDDAQSGVLPMPEPPRAADDEPA